MKKKEKLLILAPHTDDETLGCGGLIAKTTKEGGEVYILVFTYNYGSKDSKEFRSAIQKLGVDFSNCTFTFLLDQALKLDQTGIKRIISEIERVCDKFKPTIVAIPFVGFHQDHEVIGKASMVALRPHGYMPQKVLIYEQPYYGVWTTQEVFKPSYYIDITNQLDKKIKALECYKSQKIPFDMVKAMAQIRGGESGTKYAEAYMLLREII